MQDKKQEALDNASPLVQPQFVHNTYSSISMTLSLQYILLLYYVDTAVLILKPNNSLKNSKHDGSVENKHRFQDSV